MLGKLVNGNLISAHGKVLVFDDVVIANPREEDFIRAGYKDVIDGEHLPEKEGYYESPVYTDDGEVIRTTYEYKEVLDDNL